MRDFRVTPRVQVADSGGTLRDLSEFFVSAQFTSTLEAATDSVSVVFSREDGVSGGTTGSLAPLMSADPPLEEGREIVLSVAITALGVAPSASDFVERFRGRIDRVEWPTRTPRVEVTCRDQGGALIDRMLEAGTYGADDGSQSVEDVMQQILIAAGTGVTLHVPTPTGSWVPEYPQQAMSVMEALRALADTIGWSVRYRYDASGVSRLTLYSPERSKTTPDHTIGPDRYRDVTALSTDVDDVRNVVRVTYVTMDGTQETVEARDEASIAKYGERLWVIHEGDESPVHTAAQATAMAEGAVADLARPGAEHAIETLIVPEVRLGDIIEFPANNVHYSSAQRLAVVSHRWELSRTTQRSTIQTRGKPASGRLRWLRRGKQAGSADESAHGILNLREVYRDEAAGTVRYAGTPGAQVREVWTWQGLAAKPVTADPWPDPETVTLDGYTPHIVTPGAEYVWEFALPDDEHLRYVQMEPRDEALKVRGPVYRLILFPAAEFDEPVAWAITVREDGNTGTLRIAIIDPDRLLSHVRFDGKPGGGDLVTDQAPTREIALNVWEYDVALHEKHNSVVEPVIHLADGRVIRPGAETFDRDTTADIADVRVSYDGDEATVQADGDTDTAAIYYREVVSGTPGAPALMPERGGNPRYGELVLTASTAGKRTLHVWGRNAAAQDGPYRMVEVSRYQPPTTPQALLSGAFLSVAFASGVGDQYTVSWQTGSAINDTDHAIEVQFYRSGTDTLNAEFERRHRASLVDPSDGVYTWDDTSISDSGATSTLHYARLILFERMGGVLAEMSTREIARTA